MSSSPAIPAYCVQLCVRSVFALVVARTVANLVLLGIFSPSPFVWGPRGPWSVKMKPISSRSWIGSRSQRWSGNPGECEDIPQISHKHCPTHDCKHRAPPRSVARNSLQDHRTSWCNFMHQCLSEDEISLRQCLTDLVATGRPELDDAPVAVMVNVWRSCWHESPRSESPLGLASGGGTAWQSMSAFLSLSSFAIIAAQWTGFCFALTDAVKDSPARLLILEEKDWQPQKKLTNCFEYVWCESWCWPVMSVVSICLLRTILLWGCLPSAVLCWRIDLNHWNYIDGVI